MPESSKNSIKKIGTRACLWVQQTCEWAQGQNSQKQYKQKFKSSNSKFGNPIQKNTILVSVGGKKSQALVDAGANISCVATSYLKKKHRTEIQNCHAVTYRKL